jgi:hypothetical protein
MQLLIMIKRRFLKGRKSRIEIGRGRDFINISLVAVKDQITWTYLEEKAYFK